MKDSMDSENMDYYKDSMDSEKIDYYKELNGFRENGLL